MNIAIRTDSSAILGSGHMMRCLTLAECLRTAGARVVFICRYFPGNVMALAQKRGFSTIILELDEKESDWRKDAAATAGALAALPLPLDWLIVDHYGLDKYWEQAIRPYTDRMMVIDDLADRSHDCELLLDTNLTASAGQYLELVPARAKLCLGPEYALLRDNFTLALREQNRGAAVRRLQVFFGGSDPTNETGKVLQVLKEWPERDFMVEVIVGAGNSLRNEIQADCQKLDNVIFACQVEDMAERMAQADLAIGAGGTTSWERCYLGLPSIVISVAENQVKAAEALAETGAIDYLGFYNAVNAAMIRQAIERFLADPLLLAEMSCRAQVVVPHNGAEKVADILLRMRSGAGVPQAGNVLVSSASRKIPLLQAVRQALDRLGEGGQVIAADQDGDCLARHFVADFWQMPLLSCLTDEKLLAGLRQYGIKYIVPTRDGELLFWSERNAWLKQQDIVVMTSADTAVQCCLDKLLFYEQCRVMDIPAIETVMDINELKADCYVVKERYGAGSRSIGIRLSKEAAAMHARQMEQPVFQPFIEGREYSVDAYVDKQGQVKGLVCRSRDVVVNGESQVTTTQHKVDLEECCAEYIERLGLYGHVILQVIVTGAGQVAVIECNPRFGGASTLSIAAGLESFYWFLLENRGEDLAKYPFFRSGRQIRLIRYPQDKIVEVKA